MSKPRTARRLGRPRQLQALKAGGRVAQVRHTLVSAWPDASPEIPITGPLGESVREIGPADSSLTYVSRAVCWISGHSKTASRVEELARSCG